MSAEEVKNHYERVMSFVGNPSLNQGPKAIVMEVLATLPELTGQPRDEFLEQARSGLLGDAEAVMEGLEWRPLTEAEVDKLLSQCVSVAG